MSPNTWIDEDGVVWSGDWSEGMRIGKHVETNDYLILCAAVDAIVELRQQIAELKEKVAALQSGEG